MPFCPPKDPQGRFQNHTRIGIHFCRQLEIAVIGQCPIVCIWVRQCLFGVYVLVFKVFLSSSLVPTFDRGSAVVDAMQADS